MLWVQEISSIKFKVGDVVKQYTSQFVGIVWKVDSMGWPCVIYFDGNLVRSEFDITTEQAPSSLNIIKPNKTLKQHGRYCIKIASEKGFIDNLTYIELLGKLK